MKRRRRLPSLVVGIVCIAPALVALALIGPPPASAQGFYAAVRGGPGVTSDTRQGPPGREDTFEYKTGFTGSAAVGYRLPFDFRGEGEVGYIYTPVSRDGGVAIDGSVKSWLFMANVYYDVKLRVLGPFTPYLGFGIGAARVNEDHEIFINRLGVRANVDDWRTTFAYQVRIGITYDVNPWLDLSAGYRFVRANASSPTVDGQRINYSGMNNHSLELGFAVKF